jgi:hypothetical protein
LIIPAVATQLPAAAAKAFAPEGFLGGWLAGDTHTKFGLPDADRSAADNQIDGFPG